MLNAAVIGLGWWGKELVRSVQDTSAFIRFSRAVTLEPELAREFAAKTGLAIGTSYDDVLADPKIDAVVLATPHSQHRRQVEAAAAAGKHVFCEKPFALSLADAKAALAACRAANVALGVGHNRRLWPSIRRLRELMDEGRFGTIMHAEGHFSHDWLAHQPAGDWRSAPEETKAGAVTGMGIHLIDCFGFLIGPMRRIAALSTRRSGGGIETIELDTTNHVGLNLESFARTALGEGKYQIDDEGILHTVAALDALFRSTAANGAWQEIG